MTEDLKKVRHDYVMSRDVHTHLERALDALCVAKVFAREDSPCHAMIPQLEPMLAECETHRR